MKKLISIALLLVSPSLVQAQSSSKFYMQLNGGGHVAKQYFKQFSPNEDALGFGYSAGFSAGLVKNRWQMEAGLSYLSHTAALKNMTLIFLKTILTLQPVCR